MDLVTFLDVCERIWGTCKTPSQHPVDLEVVLQLTARHINTHTHTSVGLTGTNNCHVQPMPEQGHRVTGTHRLTGVGITSHTNPLDPRPRPQCLRLASETSGSCSRVPLVPLRVTPSPCKARHMRRRRHPQQRPSFLPFLRDNFIHSFRSSFAPSDGFSQLCFLKGEQAVCCAKESRGVVLVVWSAGWG